MPAAIIIAGVIIAGSILYTNAFPGPTVQGQELPAVDAHVPAPSAKDHIQGSIEAPVVLIEYSDFQCPYCSLIYPTLRSIVDSSGGQIAWVMRHNPLSGIHPQATPSANASECIAEQLGNDGFWEFADRVFADQGAMNPQFYRLIAQNLGANTAAYDSCIANKKYQSTIDAQAREAQDSGGNGTPFTIVFGKGRQIPISGALPKAQFEAVIKAL